MTIPDSSEYVHAAILAALKADAGLAAIVGTRVYDAVPQATAYPFVFVTVEAGQAWDGGGGLAGWESLIAVEAWSEKAGSSAEIYAIGRRVVAVLHGQDLALAAGTMINMRLEASSRAASLVRDDDQARVSRTHRFRVLTEG